jgi:hypothetical protein
MKLKGPKLGELHKAILGAYDSPDLERCLLFRLDIRLFQIVADKSFEQVVFDFLLKMEEEGNTAGVLESLKDDRPKNQEFVAVCDEMLRLIKGPAVPASSPAGPPPAGPSASRPRTVSADSVERSKTRMREIEDYLRRIADLLPAPVPADSLLSVLRPILAEDSEGSRSLRTALGFPRDFQRSERLYDLVASDEPSMQPVLNVLAQRVNMLMWRFRDTLEEISDEWARRAEKVANAVIACCEPRLPARQPTLLDFMSSADPDSNVDLDSHLEAVGEPAPDIALYAALRAIDNAQNPRLPINARLKARLERKALDFLFHRLSELLAGPDQVEDSSNAWWALRTGICARDDRFLGLLTGVAEK